MRAGTRLGACAVVDLVVALAAVLLGAGDLAPLLGWDAAATTYVVWTLAIVARADAARTREVARQDDPSAPVTDVALLVASVASLVGVGLLLGQSSADAGPISVSLATVVLSWLVVHLLFTTRYARLYYGDDPGGIDFNEEDDPRYLDFAYLAFTIGMAFAVSDTDITDKTIRAVVLRHSMVSYVFGAVILASTINLVAGLSK